MCEIGCIRKQSAVYLRENEEQRKKYWSTRLQVVCFELSSVVKMVDFSILVGHL